MKKLVLFQIAFLFTTLLHAQMNITGTVRDMNRETLPGATVTVQGIATGTVTDANGVYSIRANEGDVLEFSYVGMLKQSVTVSGRAEIGWF